MIDIPTAAILVGAVIASVAAAYIFGKKSADCCGGHDWEPQYFTIDGDKRVREALGHVVIEKEARFRCAKCDEKKVDYLRAREIGRTAMNLADGVRKNRLTGRLVLK